MTRTKLMRPAILLAAVLLAILSIGIALAAPVAQEGKRGLFGTVTAVDKGSITLQQGDQTVALKVDSNTKVSIPGKAAAQVTDISLGSRVAVVAEQRSDGTYATMISVIAAQPKAQHITLTVVEVSGRTIIGETSEGEQVVVELDFDPPPELIGQIATFVGEQPESNRFKARALQKLQNVVERLEKQIDEKKRDVQSEQAQNARELKQKELEELKGRLEDNLREHLDRLAEVASKAPPQSKEALEKALEKIKQGYRDAAAALEKAPGEVDDLIEQRTIVGQVASVDPATGAIGVRTRGDALVNVTATADTRIRIDEEPGTLSDVHVGDPVQVHYDPKTSVASQIRLLVISQVEGLLRTGPIRIDNTPALTLELPGGATVTLAVPPSARIEINDRPATLDNLTLGMKVEARYNSRTMQLIRLEAKLEAELELTVEQVDLSSKTITGRTRDGKSVTVQVTEETRVEAKGNLFSIVGLQPGATITVRINPVTNEALRIVIEEPEEEKRAKLSRAQGTIKAIDRDARTLTLALPNRSELTLTFGPFTKIRADGEEATPADFQPGMSVTVAYDHTSLAMVNAELHRAPTARGTERPPERPRVEKIKAEGTITAVDQLQGTVTIFTRRGEKLVLKVTAQTSLVFNDKRLNALSELPVATAVTVEYSTDGNVAIAIVAEKKEASERAFVVPHVLEAKGIIAEVAPARGIVVIKTEKGEALTLRITADTAVVINVPARESRRLGSISDLYSGAKVVVQYNESDLALRIVINEPGLPSDRGGVTLKAKGIVKGGGTGAGGGSITIVTEQGATLTLTMNDDTQIVVDEPGLRQTPKRDFGDRVRGASVTVEYTSDNVALRIVINEPGIPPDKPKATLKAKGIVKGIGSTGGSPSITIVTEGGATLTLTVNANTQIAIDEEGVQRRVSTLSELLAGARLEVEYTADGVAMRISTNMTIERQTNRTPVPTAQATLKAKGSIKGIGAGPGGGSITIVTEQGATLTLTVNASTQITAKEEVIRSRRVTSVSELASGDTVEVEYTADGLARVIIVDIKPSSDRVQPTPTKQSEPPKTQATPTKPPDILKAKGVIKGVGGGTGTASERTITIVTEGGATLTLSVNATTQFAINEPGVQRRVASLADLTAGASVEVEYTADGVAKSIIQNIRA